MYNIRLEPENTIVVFPPFSCDYIDLYDTHTFYDTYLGRL